MKQLIAMVLRRRWWVCGALGLCTLLAAISASRMTVSNTLEGMLLGEHPEFERYADTIQRYGNESVVVYAIDEPDFLRPASQARLRGLAERLRAMDGVATVRTVLDAVHLASAGGLPVPVRYADQALADPARSAAIARRMADDPLIGGVLAGRDGASHAIVVLAETDIARADGKDLEHGRRIAAMVYDVYPAEQIHVVGLGVALQEVFVQTTWTMQTTVPLIVAAVLLGVWVLFGRLWPALLSVTAGGLAVLWTLGIAALVDPQLNIMMTLIPGVILIVAFSDVVHLCSAYLLELDAGHDKEAAILEACSDVGRACLFTSITTLVGFVGLSFVPVPVFRTLGWSLGLGVALALLLAVTIVPIALFWMPRPRSLRGGIARLPQRWVDRALAGAQHAAMRRPRWVIAAFAVLALAAVAGTARLDIETDFLKRLDAESRVRVDARWFNERFHGTNAVQVLVEAPKSLDDPAWLARVAEYQRALESERHVRKVASVLTVASAVHRATPAGAGAVVGALPEQPERLGALVGLVRGGAGRTLGGLVDESRRELRLLVALEDLGVRDTSAASERFEALAAHHLDPHRVHAISISSVIGAFLDVVVEAQATGFAVTVVLVTILMILGLRSLRVGLLSLVPNLLPLGVVAAVLTTTSDRVDSDFFVVLLIALGIGVDDTIHFLVRLRHECLRGGSQDDAIRRTFAFAGRGIFMTTVILAVAFTPFLITDYMLLKMMGFLLPLCFVVAVLADLLLIPAMAQVGWIRFDATAAMPRAHSRRSRRLWEYAAGAR